MIRKGLSLCSRRYRYMMSATLIAIVILHFIKHRGYLHNSFNYEKCEKFVFNGFSDKAKYFGKEKRRVALNATDLRRWILNQNAQEKVLNLDIYGPLTTSTLIFVVQVHQYSCNINYLLTSLSEVEGIQDALVIFSHSYVDYNLNRLLQSIEVCRILQLFYPYSIQAYPDEFPGYDKNDCPTNINMNAAKKINCNSAMTPDIHGRYRDPIHAEKKHHWWWTVNKIFRDLSYTTAHKGLIVFLEHNFYIYKNFIYIAYEMKSIAQTLPQCEFLSLGSTLSVTEENAYSLVFTTWDPKYHSSILVIDISAWNTIESHYDIFCGTDDSSWSRSLYEISLNRRDGKMFKVLSSAAARELKTTCSSNGDVIDCHAVENVIEIINLQKIDQEVFPPYFEIFHDIELYDEEVISADYVEINGGWNDRRDQRLCSNMTINKIRKYYVTKDKEFDLGPYY